MAAYLIQRFLWIVPVLFAVMTITFVLMHQVPGGPWDQAKRLPPEALENVNRADGLDQPLWEQFGRYVYGVAHGDLGVSFRDRNRPVADILADGMRVSATLGALALALSVTAGVGLGMVSALRKNGLPDHAAIGFATLAASVPSFILGMLLLLLFTAYLHWLPSGGWGSPQQAIMPVLALSALPTAFIARVTRASMLDVLGEDYIRTARAKGLAAHTIVVRHMLRNAMIPVLTVIGPLAAVLVTGSFIVERFFLLPGLGREAIEAIQQRNTPVIMACVIVTGAMFIVINLIVDIAQQLVDPRIRESQI